jgi:hypothetical protein
MAQFNITITEELLHGLFLGVWYQEYLEIIHLLSEDLNDPI